MLYHFYLWLFTDFSIGKTFLNLSALALIIGFIWIGGAVLFRWLLLPITVVEAYLMSPGYACSYGGFFKRADAVSGMCQGAPYHAYLNQNFGLHLWYIQAIYAGLFLFAIWPFISKIIWSVQDEEFQKKSRMAEAKAYVKSFDRINRMDKTGSM